MSGIAKARRGLTTLIASVVALGCDGATETEPPDASTPDAVVDSATSDAAPADLVAPAGLPSFLPCPAGWVEIPSSAPELPTICSPYPESGPEDCPDGEAHFMGEAGCVPVGTVCPADGWPTGLPDGADVVYVDVEATAPGDGSVDAPFATLSEGLTAVPDGGIVAVAPGFYRDNVSISRPVTVWGACADVEIGGASFVFSIQSAGVVVKNLSVVNAATAFSVGSDDDLLLEGVVIRNMWQHFIAANSGGTVVLRDVAVSDVGGGVQVSDPGGSITFERVVLEDASTPILLAAGTEATLEDVAVIRSTEGRLFPAFILATDGASVTVRRFYATAIDVPKINLAGGAAFVGEDIVFEGTPEVELSETDVGFALFSGATVELSRARLIAMGGVGLGALQAGTTFVLTDTWFADPRLERGTLRAEALEIGLGSEGSVERFLATGCRGVCVLALEPDTRITMTDATFLDAQPDVSGARGRAIQVQQSASMTGARVAIRRGHEIGLVAAHDASAVISDLEITGIRAVSCEGCASAGIGLASYRGGRASLDRFRISRADLVGVQVALGGEMDLSNGVIEGHPVGANVQDPDFDVNRLTNDVRYEDNDVNLDSSELPVPPPGVGL